MVDGAMVSLMGPCEEVWGEPLGSQWLQSRTRQDCGLALAKREAKAVSWASVGTGGGTAQEPALHLLRRVGKWQGHMDVAFWTTKF